MNVDTSLHHNCDAIKIKIKKVKIYILSHIESSNSKLLSFSMDFSNQTWASYDIVWYALTYAKAHYVWKVTRTLLK